MEDDEDARDAFDDVPAAPQDPERPELRPSSPILSFFEDSQSQFSRQPSVGVENGPDGPNGNHSGGNQPRFGAANDRVEDSARRVLIWGTTVDAEKVQEKFLSYLQSFVSPGDRTEESVVGDEIASEWADKRRNRAAVLRRRLAAKNRRHDERRMNGEDSDSADDLNGAFSGYLSDDDLDPDFIRDRDDFVHLLPPVGSGPPLYPRLFQSIAEESGQPVVNLNVECLREFDPNLYAQLVKYPAEMLPIFDGTAQAFFEREFVLAGTDPLDIPKLQIRPFGTAVKFQRPMRLLDPVDMETLVTVRGMVTRTSSLIPNLYSEMFICSMCGAEIDVVPTEGEAERPVRCPNCERAGSMRMVANRSGFTDMQWIRLQETPESIPEGETPHTVSLFAYDDLVDAVRPGDRVTVTGVFRAKPVRAKATQRALRAVYKTYLDVHHFQSTSAGQLSAESADADLAEGERVSIAGADRIADAGSLEGDETADTRARREELIRALAAQPDIVTRLVASLAPNVWSLEDIKRGVLCMLFGGVSKTFDDRGMSRSRGEINILMCGDPGTSKSQLMQYVHKIAPRGMFTSGKGSSAVGLTAFVARDPETKESVLESGALVLSDRGVCCIDEFDKMDDMTRAVLHEAMEQQTVSVAKAGIIATLNARASVLAAANPRESRYNPGLSVVENIQLPPTLLSRFDLIYLVLDKVDANTDRRLASHLVSLYFDQTVQPDTSAQRAGSVDEIAAQMAILDRDLLAHYISLAKDTCFPIITDEAETALVAGYLEMRSLGSGSNTITATPRQLESLIRISEAHAKMHLRDHVTLEDVAEAVRLVRSALQQSAVDPRTGRIDMDLITTGRSALSRQHAEELSREVAVYLDTLGADVSLRLDQLQRQMTQQSTALVIVSDLREAVRMLEDEGVVVVTGGDRNPLIRRARTV